jgi:20S proteasome alpha/beta subunit
MTTIAWRGDTLAADTLATCGNLRDGYMSKIQRIRGFLVAGAGSVPIYLRFVDWVASGMRGESPYIGSEYNGNGLLITPEYALCFSRLGPWRITTPFYSIGSGWELALGAMEMGASAEEAVRIAMRWDTGSGGEIMTLKLSHRAES